MFGLVLAIGIVVDDAIVVVEAVIHHLEQGKSPREATVKAMEEVTAPVIGIALILSAVFVPVALLGGLVGSMYKQFALTIAISVLLSAFNALSLTPALCAMLLKAPRPMRGPLGVFFRGFNKVFDVTTTGYVSVSRILVRQGNPDDRDRRRGGGGGRPLRAASSRPGSSRTRTRGSSASPSSFRPGPRWSGPARCSRRWRRSWRRPTGSNLSRPSAATGRSPTRTSRTTARSSRACTRGKSGRARRCT